MEKYISIIIPCYNAESYIDRCFDSLRCQTIGVEHLEIILVDDCSTDNTWECLQRLESSYPDSVIIVHCDENGRQGKARNIGMEYARAPYIGFVDSDDWIEPDMYEKMYRNIRKHHCDFVMCRNWRDFADPKQQLPPKKTGKDDRLFLIDTPEKRKTLMACTTFGFGVWDKLFRRDLLTENRIFFPENLAYEDHFFSVLLYFYTSKFYLMEERFYHYYVNPQSTVLSANSKHHLDILIADMLWWEECKNRGLADTFLPEMEYFFLTLCYLASMKMIILRLQEVPYEYFLRLKDETLKHVPDYHANPYIKDFVTPANQLLLELLDRPVSKADLTLLCGEIKQMVQSGKISL